MLGEELLTAIQLAVDDPDEFLDFLRLIQQEAICHMWQLSLFRNPAGIWSDFLDSTCEPDPLRLSGGKWSFLYLDFRKGGYSHLLTDRWRQLLAFALAGDSLVRQGHVRYSPCHSHLEVIKTPLNTTIISEFTLKIKLITNYKKPEETSFHNMVKRQFG